MSLLLAGGSTPTNVTGTISWTSANSTFNVAIAEIDSAVIGWTSANGTINVAASVNNNAAIGWTSANSTFNVVAAEIDNATIGWTSANGSINITGDVSSGSVTATISWTSANSTFAIVGNIPQSNVISGGGGGYKNGLVSIKHGKKKHRDEEYLEYSVSLRDTITNVIDPPVVVKKEPIQQPVMDNVVQLQVEPKETKDYSNHIRLLLLAA